MSRCGGVSETVRKTLSQYFDVHNAMTYFKIFWDGVDRFACVYYIKHYILCVRINLLSEHNFIAYSPYMHMSWNLNIYMTNIYLQNTWISFSQIYIFFVYMYGTCTIHKYTHHILGVYIRFEELIINANALYNSVHTSQLVRTKLVKLHCLWCVCVCNVSSKVRYIDKYLYAYNCMCGGTARYLMFGNNKRKQTFWLQRIVCVCLSLVYTFVYLFICSLLSWIAGLKYTWKNYLI